jgi:hypothetical protein
MFYLFPIDSILRDKGVTVDSIDRSNLCLSKDRDVARRCLHLFHHVPPNEIVTDLKDMGITGLACVGVDGASIAVEDIRSERYTELIRKCREAGLMFIHAFPFADTYHNDLTKKYPHIKQKNFAGRIPFVGWDEENGHLNVDYGSDEFIEFCKESIAALHELGVQIIDFAEPDHYPIPDNGYGESLVNAWTQQTGQPAPPPRTVEYRRFMEDRNLRGVKAIGDYARHQGMLDHLTASPLCHSSPLICQNYGKYSRTEISQLSTTYHAHYGYNVSEYMDRFLQMHVLPAQLDGIGCVESKSMRSWSERHAVYLGCGQGLSLERIEDFLNSVVFLHQMDFFMWDYGNFRNQSMYLYNRFEDPAEKFSRIKRLVRSTVDGYFDLPLSYREANVAPDALVLYAKQGDYLRYIDEDRLRPSAWESLYSIAVRLQSSDISFMFAYDEYPEVLENEGRKVPLLIIDGVQPLSRDFANATAHWFGKGKTIFVGGEIGDHHTFLLRKLGERLALPFQVEPSEIETPRNAEYLYAQPSIPISNWQPLLTLNGKGIVFARGTPASGILVYSIVPLCRLARKDLQQTCGLVFDQVKHTRMKVDGLLEHEVVTYRGKETTFFSIKNHTGENGVLTVRSPSEPLRIFPRSDETQGERQDDGFKLELSFRPREVRIVEVRGLWKHSSDVTF